MNHSRSGYSNNRPRPNVTFPRVPSSRLSQGDSNRIKYHASGVPILGDFIRASDSQYALEDYMRFTGLSWADVKYPSRVMGAGQYTNAMVGVGSSMMGGAMYSRILRMYR